MALSLTDKMPLAETKLSIRAFIRVAMPFEDVKRSDIAVDFEPESVALNFVASVMLSFPSESEVMPMAANVAGLPDVTDDTVELTINRRLERS